MSPVPIIDRQRALSRIGEIRCGDEKQNGKVGRKLETFRLTSQHREILDRAAELYGGEVREWESPTGQAWQLITAQASLPVLVIPGYSLKRAYEKWDGPSKRVRLCDGEEEVLSGQPCLCNEAGKDECKLLTRLMVLLPETGTSLGWQLSSTGDTAADELAFALKIAEGIAAGRPFVPAKLRLTQRRGQQNGQATRFVVPVLEFDPQQRLASGELPGGQPALSTPSDMPALPSGYTPLAENGTMGVSVREGLELANTQVKTRTGRSAAPLPNVDADVQFGPAPVPQEPGAPSTAVASASSSPRADTAPPEKPLSLAECKKKMNAIVGQLRDDGVITTEQLYGAVAAERKVDVETMIALVDGRDEAGELHWAKLRDSLDTAEARVLHARLARFWAQRQDDAA